MSNRRDMLKKLGITNLANADGETRGFLRGLITEFIKNFKKFRSPEAQEYFYNLIAAIMLEHHKAYESFDIQVPGRLKSPKSIFDKVLDYLSRQDKSVYDYNDYNEYQGKLRDYMSDLFAITIVACNRPATFYSKDPEIQELIEEKKRNHILLGEMQKFKLSVVKDEFSGSKQKEYNYFCTKKQYYINSIMILERLKTMIDPRATKLLAYYNRLLDEVKKNVPERFFYVCDNKIKELNEVENLNTTEKLEDAYKKIYEAIDEANLSEEEDKELKKKITPKDTKSVDFLELEKDFNARIHDKLDLAVLTKQICSIFDKSELLKKFGVELEKDTRKKKRTASGYVSNLYYLKTSFGKIEIQLQSQHENNEGNYGHTAHGNMVGKLIERFDIPNLSNKNAVKKFRTCVAFVSPKKFFAQFDNTEPDRVLIQTFGDYQNYKSISSQVKKGSDEDKENIKYFNELYPKKDKLFPNDAVQEEIKSFIEYDIEQYLEGDKFKQAMKLAKAEKDLEEER